MANDKFPVTKRTDVLPDDNRFPRKTIRDGWGAETEAANMPNTPSMKQYKRVSSYNPYADYCDPDKHQIYEQYQVTTPKDDE